MEPLVKIKNLTVGYDRIPAIEDVCLDIYEQDFLGVIGPNGGGKTTLLKAILGLLKPMGGEVAFRHDLDHRHKAIGYLPQVRHIDKKFPITVLDVIKSGAIMDKGNVSRAEIRERADTLLEEMGIIDVRSKAIGELSGGQMQRVFLCRALLPNPRLLILDEPDTFVDNRFEGELYERLRLLNKEVAIVLVSHDVGTISAYVKTIACVNKRVHYHPSNIITQEQLNAYNCPIQIISHGEIPHTILKHHH